MGKSFCIVCEKQKDGIDVQDDLVLDSIRWFKTNVTHNERNNRLVVCRGCYVSYKSKRARFESRRRIYLILGFVFVALFVVVSPGLSSALVGAGLFVLFWLFSLLNYTPRINIKNQRT